ncbi:hypothetical protein JTB14_002951 [Gonioctena quinquepunctata]|nr:hypothetical protein JTB14_002951 [Gonioctena quinquepunctata]
MLNNHKNLQKTTENQPEQVICEFPEEDKESAHENEGEMRTSDSSSSSSDENEESFTYNEQESTVTRSGRTVKIPQNLQDYEIYTAYCLLTKVDQDPKTYKEASIMLDWQQAIDKELSSHEKLETWQPAKLPVGQRAIDTRWLFKTKEDGTKKARLVAKGPEDQVQELLRDLRNEFNIKEMTVVKTFLGMEISKNEKGLKITQTRMITRLLEEFSMIETRNVATPMEVNFQVKEEEPIINNVPYRRLICSLMYFSLVSRPDISYSVAYSSRFLDKPRKSTWEAGKRILRYLNHTKEYGLQFKKGNMQELMALCDADWGGDQETRKSVSAFVCFHAGNPIAWHSRKQTCVAQSSMEAEYISADIASQELVNLKGILSEFKVCESVVLKIDNLSAISLIKNFENSKRSKHIDIKYHFIKDLCLRKEIILQYIPTNENVSDMFTKPLNKEKFSKCRLGILGH